MRTKIIVPKALILFLLIFIVLSCCKNENKGYSPITSVEKYRELRTEKLKNPRTVIHNNDG